MVAVGFGVLGLAAGIAVSRRFTPEHVASSPAAAPNVDSTANVRVIPVVGPTTARLADEDREALRALVREELAALRPAKDSSSADRAEDRQTPEPPIAGDQIRAYDALRAKVDDSIARGVWTAEDRVQARAARASLSPRQFVETVRPLTVAVNLGKVRFEGPGPLF
jgi:hypothetical protein